MLKMFEKNNLNKNQNLMPWNLFSIFCGLIVQLLADLQSDESLQISIFLFEKLQVILVKNL